MTRGDFIRLVAVGLLGCVARTAGRDIPVYREYSQPIAFYDDQGELIGFGTAPDVYARRSLRDAKAQEDLLGKETLLDIAYPGGSSVFGVVTPKLGSRPPAPAARGRDENRRRRNDGTDRNWLAGSLSLPSLGQSSSNTATLAMGVAEEESSWGWLAGDVAARAEEQKPRSQDPQVPDESGMLPDALAALPHGEDIADAGTGLNPGDSGSATAIGERLIREPEDAESARKPAAVPGQAGNNQGAEANSSAYRPDLVAGGMNQTRSLLAEISTQMRPTLSSLLQVTPDDGIARLPTATPMQNSDGSSLLGLSFKPSQASTLPGSLSTRTATAGSLQRMDSTGSSWQGGWKSKSAPETLSSYLTTGSDPQSPQLPATTIRVNPKPGFTSGGYKPAWY